MHKMTQKNTYFYKNLGKKWRITAKNDKNIAVLGGQKRLKLP